MANWFTNSASAPNVPVEYQPRVEKRTAFYKPEGADLGIRKEKRTATTTGYEKRGMANATANAFADSVASDDVTATVTPIGGGGYNVLVTTETVGEWEADE